MRSSRATGNGGLSSPVSTLALSYGIWGRAERVERAASASIRAPERAVPASIRAPERAKGAAPASIRALRQCVFTETGPK